MTQTIQMISPALVVLLLVVLLLMIAFSRKEVPNWKLLTTFLISAFLFLFLLLLVIWYGLVNIGETLSVGQKKIIVVEKGFDFKEGIFFIVQEEGSENIKVLYAPQIRAIENEMKKAKKKVKEEREKEERKNEIIRKYLNLKRGGEK